jgi:hypothetical protein
MPDGPYEEARRPMDLIATHHLVGSIFPRPFTARFQRFLDRCQHRCGTGTAHQPITQGAVVVIAGNTHQPAGGLRLRRAISVVATSLWRDQQPRRGNRRLYEFAFFLVALASAIAFLVVRPPVGDLFAARAREAAVRHGVGLHYWFSWYSGSVPGQYSVVEPYVAAAVGSVLLGAISAAGVALAAHRVLAHAPRRTSAFAFVCLGVTTNLWSGRIPFLMGCFVALLCVAYVQAGRRTPALLLGALSAFVTPTCAAFLLLGLVGVLLADGERRAAALSACLGAGASMIGVALYFGSPGNEGFRTRDVILICIGCGMLLALDTPRHVRVSAALTLVACLAAAAVPNALGSNIQRFPWFVLTVACVATSRSRRWTTGAAATLVLSMAIVVTARDLHVAAQPMSSPTFYRGVNTYLSSIPRLANHRVETVFDGTHNAANALPLDVLQARGYETQADNQLDGILRSERLDADLFRSWLDANAVGYVLISQRTLSTNPEYRLVRDHTPDYLQPQWSDAGLILYRVTRPTSIASAPSSVISVSPSSLTVHVPAEIATRRVVVRIRWSRFLKVTHAPNGVRLNRAPGGWTFLVTPAICDCVISG